jgi:hypothetical protein
MAVDRGPRNLQLKAQVGKNNPFRKLAFGLLDDISGGSAKDLEALGQNRNWSPEGRKNEARNLTRKAERARHDRLKPLAQYNAETEAMQAKVKLPDLDRTDEYAVRLHFRMLDLSYDMTPLERMGLMSGPGRDPDFIDAVSREKPWVSGLREKSELDVLAQAKEERLAELHGPLQDTIAARKSNSDEVMMIANMVRGDLLSDSVDAGLTRAEFEAEAKAIESKVAAEAPKASPAGPTAPPSPEFEEIWKRFDQMVDAATA